MKNNIYILHNFNARPYFEAVEYYAEQNSITIEYRETNWFKSIIKLLIGRKCINCDIKSIINNIKFCLNVPFMKNQTIIYGTAPYDFRFLWYSLLKDDNNFIYHTSHHKWGDDKNSVFLYGIFTVILKNLWKKILSHDNLKIVTVTKESKRTIENNFIDKNKLVYQIYHSIDIKKFETGKKVYMKRLKILFVGRFVYEKGLDIIVNIINTVDPLKYEFSFVGDGNYKHHISHIFQKENVHYLGWVSDKNAIASIYKEHDILLNPSVKHNDWEELFGIVNIEAMATGMIVIASDHIGPKEIIQNGVNGFLVKEKDPDAIMEILERLYYNREYLINISSKAKERATDFSIERVASQWGKVIDLNNRRGGVNF